MTDDFSCHTLKQKASILLTEAFLLFVTFTKKCNHSIMKRGFGQIVVVAIAVVFLVGVGATFSYIKFKSKPAPQLPPVSQSSPLSKLSPSPAASPDKTANWKTYTNKKRGYEFRYPESYKLKETQASTNTFEEEVYLEKDTEYAVGQGFGGSDVLTKGVAIYFQIYSNSKDLSESALKSEYASNISTRTIKVDKKEGLEIILPDQIDRVIYIKYNNIVLGIFTVTSSSNPQENKVYLKDFSKILSTFRFI